MRVLLAALALSASLLASAALAQAPSTFSYQGVLTDAAGNLAADGNYSLTFRIYDVASGGVALWTEAQGVTIDNGGFSAVLGSVTPLNLAFDKPYWLGIQVFAEAELSPRVRLTSSPYAMSLRLPFSQTLTSGSPLVTLHNTGTGPALLADPDLNVGGAESGVLRLFRAGVANRVIEGNTTTTGGNLLTFDELGNTTNQVAADGNGSGGFLACYRAPLTFGFLVDGNDGGSGEPNMTVFGTVRSAVFDMASSGNTSVALPTDAIAATETLDEPGVGAETDDAGLSMDGTVQTLLSRTITVPASGWVVAIATAQINISHSNGTASGANFGVSNVSTALPVNQDMPWNLPAVAPTGSYFPTITVHGTFPVNAGANTFYFLGEETGGTYSLNDRQLTVLYVPTAYGTVTPPGPAKVASDETQGRARGGLTTGEIAAEQDEARAFHEGRVSRELEAMRAQLEALQSKLARVAAEQAIAATKPVKP